MKKIFKYFVAVFAFLVALTVNVSASAPANTTHYLKYITDITPYAHSGNAAVFTEKLPNGSVKYSYCFDHSRTGSPNGTTMTYDGEVTDGGIIWLLANGQGGSWNSSYSLNGNADHRSYATQMALWIYQGSLSISPTGNIGRAAVELANNAKTKRVTTPSIKIAGGGAMSLSSDGKYYQTGTLTVTGSGYSTYKVTLVNLPADAEIVAGSSVKKSGESLSAGTNFYVRIPVSKVGSNLNATIKVSATGKKYHVYRFRNNAAQDKQRIIYIDEEPITVEASTTATLSPKGSLKITKVDVSTGTEVKLAGVKLTVKNSSGAVVATWTTDNTNNPYEIKDLPLGTYTIIEESAPAGYVKSSDVTVSTKAGQTVEVKVTNSKNPSKVKISKQDITSKAELAGAHLVLKDSMGNVVDEWTSTTTPHYIQTLAAGTYTLSETIAPEGYLQTTETVTFTVEKDGGVEKRVVMYNTPIPDNTVITISKQDIATSKELPGATLVIKDANGKVVAQWVSTTKPHVIANLPIGKYTLIETKAPKGYGISDEIIEFEIKADGVQKKVVMYNSIIPVTAGMNVPLVIAGLIGTIALAGFSMFKLNKQEA